MSGLAQFWAQSDAMGRTVALLLLAMSVAAWVLILWKGWLLRRAASDIARAVPAFWDADTLEAGRSRLLGLTANASCCRWWRPWPRRRQAARWKPRPGCRPS